MQRRKLTLMLAGTEPHRHRQPGGVSCLQSYVAPGLGLIPHLLLLALIKLHASTVTRLGNSYLVPGWDLSQPCFSARLAFRHGQKACSWPRKREGAHCRDLHGHQQTPACICCR